MSWSDIYLFCFLVGLALSVLSFLAGAVHLHLPFNWHLPFHIHSGHGGGHGVGHVSHGAGAAELRERAAYICRGSMRRRCWRFWHGLAEWATS